MKKVKLFNVSLCLLLTNPIANLFTTQQDDMGILELHVIETEYHSFGHVYLRYNNLTTNYQFLGFEKVGIYSNITIGRWNSGSSGSSSSSGSVGPDFEGVYYNREQYIYPRIKESKNDIYITTIIDDVEEFNSLSNKIIELNDDYKPFSRNCGHFAYDVWNVVAEENEKLDLSFVFPSKLKTYLLNHEYLATNIENFSDYVAIEYSYYENGVRKTSQII